jgi:hypothetical protein
MGPNLSLVGCGGWLTTTTGGGVLSKVSVHPSRHAQAAQQHSKAAGIKHLRCAAEAIAPVWFLLFIIITSC